MSTTISARRRLRRGRLVEGRPRRAGRRTRPPARAPRRARAAARSAAALERAQHHDDAPVLAQVRDRLGAAADHVEIRDRAVVEHPQRPDRSLRRDVDVAFVGERRRADEEERLARDPLAAARRCPRRCGPRYAGFPAPTRRSAWSPRSRCRRRARARDGRLAGQPPRRLAPAVRFASASGSTVRPYESTTSGSWPASRSACRRSGTDGRPVATGPGTCPSRHRAHRPRQPTRRRRSAPVAPGDRERGDDRGVELRARAALELSSAASGERGRVRARARHRVERVGDGDDPRAERDVRPGQRVGVARAVPALVAVAHEPGDARERRRGADDPLADDRVAADEGPLAPRRAAPAW